MNSCLSGEQHERKSVRELHSPYSSDGRTGILIQLFPVAAIQRIAGLRFVESRLGAIWIIHLLSALTTDHQPLSIMQLGFVSAVFGDLSFEEVLRHAAELGYDCVEVMCWPPGGPTASSAG